MDRPTDTQTDGQTDRQTNGRTNGQMVWREHLFYARSMRFLCAPPCASLSLLFTILCDVSTALSGAWLKWFASLASYVGGLQQLHPLHYRAIISFLPSPLLGPETHLSDSAPHYRHEANEGCRKWLGGAGAQWLEARLTTQAQRTVFYQRIACTRQSCRDATPDFTRGTLRQGD